MTVHKATATRITGLASSGTTDGTGTWNTGVDLDTFVTVPSGVTGVILGITNEQGSPRWAGVRTPGKTAALWLADQALDSYRQEIVPLGAGNTVDLYTEETAQCHFYILGFVDWTFFDIDGPLPSIASTGSTTSTVTAPTEIPSGTLNFWARAFNGGWMPVGESTLLTASLGDCGMLVQLDGSKQVQLNTSAATQILGYAPNGDIQWTTWLAASETITNDGAPHTGSSSNAAALFAHIQWNGYTTGEGFGTREAGATVPPLPSVNTFGRAQTPPLNGSGQYEYVAEAAWANTAYVVAWLVPAGTNIDASLASLTITEQPASIGIDKHVLASLVSLSLTEQAAVLELSRNVAAALETLTLTEQQAVAQLGRDIAATSATLNLLEQVAGVTLARHVAAQMQPLSLAAQQAIIELVSLQLRLLFVEGIVTGEDTLLRM